LLQGKILWLKSSSAGEFHHGARKFFPGAGWADTGGGGLTPGRWVVELPGAVIEFPALDDFNSDLCRKKDYLINRLYDYFE